MLLCWHSRGKSTGESFSLSEAQSRHMLEALCTLLLSLRASRVAHAEIQKGGTAYMLNQY